MKAKVEGKIYFQMFSKYRKSLIEKHKFYMEQATMLLLGQLTEQAILKAADTEAEKTWISRGKNFDPDLDDEGSIADDAEQAGVWRYTLLSELRDQTRLSIVAGMFYQ